MRSAGALQPATQLIDRLPRDDPESTRELIVIKVELAPSQLFEYTDGDSQLSYACAIAPHAPVARPARLAA